MSSTVVEGGGKDDLKHSTSFSNILTGEKNSAPSGGEKINLFGGNSQANLGSTGQTGGSLFGQPAQKQGYYIIFKRSGGLFGGAQQNQAPNSLALAKKESVTAPPANSNLLQTPVKPSNPNQGEGQINAFGFGDNNTLSPGQTNQGATGGGLFGAKTGTTSSGLFGSNSKPANSTGGLFGGGGTTTSTASTGGGLFGGSSQQTPNISVGPLGSSTAGTTTGGLFGGQTSKPASGGGLFGSSTSTTGTSGGLFGSSTPGAQQNTGFNQGQGQQQQQPQNSMTVAQYMKQTLQNDDAEAMSKLLSFECLMAKGNMHNIHQGVFFERFQKTDKMALIQLLKQKVPSFQPDYEDANQNIQVNKQKYAAAQKINPNKSKYFPMQVNSAKGIEMRATFSEEAVQKIQLKLKEMEEWERGKKTQLEAQIREQLNICQDLNYGIKKKIFRLYVKLSEFIVHTNHDQSDHIEHEKLNTEIDLEIRENNQAAQHILQTKQALHSILPASPLTQTSETEEPETLKQFDNALAQDEQISMLLDILGEEKLKLERDCMRAQNLVKLVTCLERESYIVKSDNAERKRLF